MGNRSVGVISASSEKRRVLPVHRYWQARRRLSRGAAAVVSPRYSITSVTAFASQSPSFFTTGFLSVSCGPTLLLFRPDGLAAPVERALLPEINVTGQQNGDV